MFGKPMHECFLVVDEQIRSHGGNSVTGWAIWELPGVFVEAEYHAVWKSPQGDLIDVAPRSSWFPEITFLPQPSLVYRGQQLDNIRRPLVKDNDVKRFLFLMQQRFNVLNAGERASQLQVHLTDREAKAFASLERELAQLERRIHKRYASNFGD
jgi:hypothetical protein